jgi:hypothetical protein
MGLLSVEDNSVINRGVACKTIQAFERAGHKDSAIARELAIIGYSDPADYLEIAEGGELRFKTFDEMGEKRRAIKKIREKTVITESKDGALISKISTVEFELHDKLDGLGKVIGVKGINKPQKVDVSGEVSIQLVDYSRAEPEAKQPEKSPQKARKGGKNADTP